MKLKTLEMTIEFGEDFKGDPTQIRGFFASKFNEFDQLHNHNTDKFVYRYPLVQYKIIENRPFVLGLKEGVEVLKEIYDKFETVTLKEREYEVVEKSLSIKNQEFGLSNKIHFYEFLTPWLALNKGNKEKYLDMPDSEEKRALLRRTLTGNLLSMSKTLGYTVPDTIKCDVDLTHSFSKYKGIDFVSFNGGFAANFIIPDFMGIGKGVAKGFGVVREIRFL